VKNRAGVGMLKRQYWAIAKAQKNTALHRMAKAGVLVAGMCQMKMAFVLSVVQIVATVELYRYVSTTDEDIKMKKYEVNRMAVLIDIMADCMGCGVFQILAELQGSVISKEESGEIKTILEEMEE